MAISTTITWHLYADEMPLNSCFSDALQDLITAPFSSNVEPRIGFLSSQYLFSEHDGQAAVEIVLTREIATGVVVFVTGG